MSDQSFERFGGLLGVLAGVSAFLYAVSFVVLRSDGLSALFLTGLGVLSTAALVELFRRLRGMNNGFALWALMIGMIGALGAAMHGGFDLALAAHPVANAGSAELPSQVDPRGLLTFGFAGLALFVNGWLVRHDPALPRGLGWLGQVSGVLLVALYLARLVIFDPTNPVILVLVLMNGFVLNPAWWVWLGLSLWSRASAPRTAAEPAAA